MICKNTKLVRFQLALNVIVWHQLQIDRIFDNIVRDNKMSIAFKGQVQFKNINKNYFYTCTLLKSSTYFNFNNNNPINNRIHEQFI